MLWYSSVVVVLFAGMNFDSKISDFTDTGGFLGDFTQQYFLEMRGESSSSFPKSSDDDLS